MWSVVTCSSPELRFWAILVKLAWLFFFACLPGNILLYSPFHQKGKRNTLQKLSPNQSFYSVIIQMDSQLALEWELLELPDSFWEAVDWPTVGSWAGIWNRQRDERIENIGCLCVLSAYTTYGILVKECLSCFNYIYFKRHPSFLISCFSHLNTIFGILHTLLYFCYL